MQPFVKRLTSKKNGIFYSFDNIRDAASLTNKYTIKIYSELCIVSISF